MDTHARLFLIQDSRHHFARHRNTEAVLRRMFTQTKGYILCPEMTTLRDPNAPVALESEAAGNEAVVGRRHLPTERKGRWLFRCHRLASAKLKRSAGRSSLSIRMTSRLKTTLLCKFNSRKPADGSSAQGLLGLCPPEPSGFAMSARGTFI